MSRVIMLVMASLVFLAMIPAVADQTAADPERLPPPRQAVAEVVKIREGYYICRGMAPSKTAADKEYEGIATIRRSEHTYMVAWSVGTEHMLGVGMRTGDILSVSWRNGPVHGLSVFRVQRDGKLAGKWTTWERVYPEELTFLRAFGE